jgi:hypothetical protein
MTRDAEFDAKDRVRHADHKKLRRKPWHRVWMNTEAGGPWRFGPG